MKGNHGGKVQSDVWLIVNSPQESAGTPLFTEQWVSWLFWRIRNIQVLFPSATSVPSPVGHSGTKAHKRVSSQQARA